MKKYLNKKDVIVLIIGILISILMFYFPPEIKFVTHPTQSDYEDIYKKLSQNKKKEDIWIEFVPSPWYWEIEIKFYNYLSSPAFRSSQLIYFESFILILISTYFIKAKLPLIRRKQ